MQLRSAVLFFFFFFNDTATTEIYTLSLHDALPISVGAPAPPMTVARTTSNGTRSRSEEHTSELQSRLHLVCRLLLEKKKTKQGRTRLHQKRFTQNHNRQQQLQH